MNLDKNSLAELKYYLLGFEEFIDKLPLEKQLYPDGGKINQILFHAFQATNYWLRVAIMEENFPRDRNIEYSKNHSLKEIKESLKSAIEACQKAELNQDIDLSKKIKEPRKISSTNLEIKTTYDALLHATAHLAEHFGELHLLVTRII